MSIQRSAISWAAGLAFLVGCGSSGTNPTRPVETSLYVSGVSGLGMFEFASADNPCPGQAGTGIQAPNADHQFGDRVFQTPHLFVMENTLQPVRSVIHNVGDTDITANLFLGTQQQTGNVVIQPGECATVSDGTLVNPQQEGPHIQIEVCSLPLPEGTTSCVHPPVPPDEADRHLAFVASLGDIANTNVTSCLLSGLLTTCQSPATFFLQEPQEVVAVAMTVTSGQNPGGQPPAQIRVELYKNGNLAKHAGGKEPTFSLDL